MRRMKTIVRITMSPPLMKKSNAASTAGTAVDEKNGMRLARGFTCNQLVYPRCGARRAESIVDVNHRQSRCAAVQHTEQRCNATERRAVSDTRRHRNDWHGDKTTNYRRQRSFHSRADDDY